MELVLFRFRSGNQPAPRHVVRIAIITFCVILCTVGSVVGWIQHRRVTAYPPVPATALHGEIAHEQVRQGRDEEGKLWTSWESIPHIRYAYSVAGRTFTNETIFSMPYFLVDPVAGSIESARRVMTAVYGPLAKGGDRVETNVAIRAFYNPRDPSEAFLIKRCAKIPFHLILMPTGLTLLILFGGVFKSPLGRRVLAGAWHAIGIAGSIYLLRFHGLFEAKPVILLIVYEIVGLIPLSLVIFKRFASAVGEIRFSVG